MRRFQSTHGRELMFCGFRTHCSDLCSDFPTDDYMDVLLHDTALAKDDASDSAHFSDSNSYLLCTQGSEYDEAGLTMDDFSDAGDHSTSDRSIADPSLPSLGTQESFDATTASTEAEAELLHADTQGPQCTLTMDDAGDHLTMIDSSMTTAAAAATTACSLSSVCEEEEDCVDFEIAGRRRKPSAPPRQLVVDPPPPPPLATQQESFDATIASLEEAVELLRAELASVMRATPTEHSRRSTRTVNYGTNSIAGCGGAFDDGCDDAADGHRARHLANRVQPKLDLAIKLIIPLRDTVSDGSSCEHPDHLASITARVETVRAAICRHQRRVRIVMKAVHTIDAAWIALCDEGTPPQRLDDNANVNCLQPSPLDDDGNADDDRRRPSSPTERRLVDFGAKSDGRAVAPLSQNHAALVIA